MENKEIYKNLFKIVDKLKSSDDPNRKYFAFPERQYRMGGFRIVMMNLIEECKKDVRAK